MEFPNALRKYINSAEKQGGRVLLAQLGPGDHMPHRALLVAEKDGVKFMMSGQGSIEADGLFAFGLSFTKTIDDAEWERLRPATTT